MPTSKSVVRIEGAKGGVLPASKQSIVPSALAGFSQLKPLPGLLRSSAVFSSDGLYRYELWRVWNEPGERYAMFIGLNPSTADETSDDRTVRRCINFAKSWGFDALCMTNIFAFRATEPADMLKAEDPVGPLNLETLERLAKGAGVVIAAWGTNGEFMGQGDVVRGLIPNLSCLVLSKDGHPRHPLYLKATLKPVPLVR